MSSPALAKVGRGRGRGQGAGPPRTTTVPANMMTVLSRIKVDMPLNSGRGSRWGRRRPGSMRYSFMSQTSQESGVSKQPFADIEEEFLHASEFGDIPNVKRILNDNMDLNVDCIDALGRTALRLAVKNEHLEVVEVLLERSNQHHIYEAVLQAISAGHTQIAETILKHRRYLEMWKERRKLGDTDGFYKTAFPDSQFSPDITPLILAAQKNQYEIVQLLLLRGETIMKPHKFSCGCQECRNKMKFDQLRLAKYRLNAYRGLASEAYISLSSKDPILTAFELAAELRRLSRVEKHFKREYRDLADQLSDYVVKLLDRIRTQKELELVLNKTGKHHQEKFESLARFKLALNYKEKKFVAHPSCQQRVVRTWYNGVGKLERAGWPRRLMMSALFICAYPFLVLLHIFLPVSKGAKILQFPVVKFLCHAMSFMAFLVLIVVSTIEASKSVSKDRTLRSAYNSQHIVYMEFRHKTNNSVYGEDFPLRANFPTITEMMLSLWIVGMVFQECNQLFHNGFLDYIRNLYNLLDFLLIAVYLSIFTMKFWAMYKFHMAIQFFENSTNTVNETKALIHLYWLNTDRIYWDEYDPCNMLEGLFAGANILSIFRISYLLPANETLGPLQITLGRMMKDIAKFLALFLLVILAFMVGLHNLFWYYSERKKIELYLPDRPEESEVKAEANFGGVLATFRTVFWSLFGRGEPDAVKLGNYNNTFTENVGYIIYGGYNIAMVTVLLNMLIAMMTRSFTLIAEDSDREWKFARSLLYMDYIGSGGTLPAPLNLLGAPKAIFKLIFCNCCCCKKEEEEDDDDDDEKEAAQTAAYPKRKANVPATNGRDSPRTPLGKQMSMDGPSGMAKNQHKTKWTLASLNMAIEEVKQGIPKRQAAKKYGIPWGTFTDKLSGRRKIEEHIKTYLTPEEENEIVKYLQYRSVKGFSVTKKELLVTVKHMLDFRGRETKWNNNQPSDKWFRLFMKRHPEIVFCRPNILGKQHTFEFKNGTKTGFDADTVVQSTTECTVTVHLPRALNSSSAPEISASSSMLSTSSITSQTLVHSSVDFDTARDPASTLKKFAALCSQIGENTLNLYYTKLNAGCSHQDDLFSLWKSYHDEILSHHGTTRVSYHDEILSHHGTTRVSNFQNSQPEYAFVSGKQNLSLKQETQGKKASQFPILISGQQFSDMLIQKEKSQKSKKVHHKMEETLKIMNQLVDEKKRNKRKKRKQEERKKRKQEEQKKQKRLQTQKEGRKRKLEDRKVKGQKNSNKKNWSAKKRKEFGSDQDTSVDEREIILDNHSDEFEIENSFETEDNVSVTEDNVCVTEPVIDQFPNKEITMSENNTNDIVTEKFISQSVNDLPLPAETHMGRNRWQKQKCSAHPSDDISAADLYEANGRINPGFDGTPTKATPRRAQATMVPIEAEEEKLTYQQTMQRIVQRYIFDIQREAEVTEDDFEEIKQDISSFRYDLINQMTTKSAVEDELKTSMTAIMQQLQSLKEDLGPKNDGEVKTEENLEQESDNTESNPLTEDRIPDPATQISPTENRECIKQEVATDPAEEEQSPVQISSE